jgi:hypothetical protein
MAALDDEAVSTNGDVRRARGRLECSEQGQLDLEIRQFTGSYWREARVGAARRHRTFRNHATERFVGLQVSDTASKFTVTMNRHERSARTGDHANQWHRSFMAHGIHRADPTHVRNDGIARNSQKNLTVGFTGHSASPKFPSAAAM